MLLRVSPDLFGDAEAKHRETIMRESIQELTEALSTLKRSDPWSPGLKASDDFLNPLFERYFEKLELPNLLRKTNYHVLAGLLDKEEIDLEVVEKLDAIASVADQAKPTAISEL